MAELMRRHSKNRLQKRLQLQPMCCLLPSHSRSYPLRLFDPGEATCHKDLYNEEKRPLTKRQWGTELCQLSIPYEWTCKWIHQPQLSLEITTVTADCNLKVSKKVVLCTAWFLLAPYSKMREEKNKGKAIKLERTRTWWFEKILDIPDSKQF